MNEKSPTKIIQSELECLDPTAGALQEILSGLGQGDQQLITRGVRQLSAALGCARLNNQAQQLLESFHTTVWSLRRELDPTTVTMTSTNVPDAIHKLQGVLNSTEQATHALLALVERQEALTAMAERYLSNLEQTACAESGASLAAPDFITHYRQINAEARRISAEMVATQEFQDLCGQSIKKVLFLMQDLQQQMTSLLGHLQIDLPSAQSEAPSSCMTDQNDVDDLLRELEKQGGSCP